MRPGRDKPLLAAPAIVLALATMMAGSIATPRTLQFASGAQKSFFAATTSGTALTDSADNPLQGWLSGKLRDHSLVGKIWSAKAKGLVPLGELAKAIAGADYALLGEVHDNPDAHRIQAWALGLRAHARGRLNVVMEMLNDAQQPALDKVFGKPGDNENKDGAATTVDAAALLKLLEWDKTGWPDSKIYEPIFKAVLSAKGRLYPGSSKKQIVRNIGKQGFSTLSAERIKRLALDKPLPDALGKDLRKELQEGHCNMLPERAMPAMMKVQRYRDAIMASVMIAAGSQGARGGAGGAALIAGNGHVRADRAVPLYLRAMQPGAKVTVLLVMEVQAGEEDAGSYVPRGLNQKAAADFVLFVPRQMRTDQCEELRKMFSKKKKRK